MMMKKKQPLEVSVKDETGALLKPEYLSKVVEEEEGEEEEEDRAAEETALAPEAELSRPRNGLQALQQHRGCKRRNSLNSGFKHPGFKRRRRAASDCDPVLPSNFLLGGNIFDPLNLNSLLDEEVNRALNAETPKSSPLPCRNRDPVEILVPRDITDPLSLNRDSEVLPSPLKLGRKRRHRHCHHPAAEAAEPPAAAAEEELPPAPAEPQPYELNTAINCRDEIVSPVLRGAEGGGGGGGGTRHRKRRRTCSKSEPGKGAGGGGTAEEEGGEGKKSTPEKPRGKAGHASLSREAKGPPSFSGKQRRFQYGNYSKYYGYRNPGRCRDPRLGVFKADWFRGKDILDLGCNAGHLTLSIAKDLKPSRIVGVDIDGGLVHSARQNIRRFLSEDVRPSAPHARFPVSLARCKGPIAAPPVALDPERRVPDFPNNVTFVQGNYVLEKDELLEMQRPEYDVILCLSLTKWIHLNWGDEGLKRMFKRIYRHLRPGGIFILEPQPWSSYGKRRKLTETIYRNYYKIIFKPDQFTSYLLSPEVGFSSYELVGTPQSTSKGFQRPVYLFHKNRQSSAS
ncbi:7SK snRNA methylphosphate capping enzyme-like isoform X2 [Pristis pectinata]|uniref:7SK snRNA methylphosphate capping enzyme-like isoform X2 n=1 Tax=Pristis pectinata TaxID=685728 RepID=UPI00223CBC5D|nr:7SK snRNA methylphosphate capping enzyme-like isoform X2 [Pristis pectinata]